jgi:phosphatidylglycerophosphate synthase
MVRAMMDVSHETAQDKPWDARLAAQLIAPLRHTTLQPNHLTTVRLAVGLVGALVFAAGRHPSLAAWLIVLSNFLDHVDGEFARMTGRWSRFGHYYDLAADAVVTTALFVGIGAGLRHGPFGALAIGMGCVAGLAVAAIFHFRQKLESALGKQAVRQRMVLGFETEDVLYLLPLVPLFDVLREFLAAAAIGAPIGLLVVIGQHRSRMRAASG